MSSSKLASHSNPSFETQFANDFASRAKVASGSSPALGSMSNNSGVFAAQVVGQTQGSAPTSPYGQPTGAAVAHGVGIGRHGGGGPANGGVTLPSIRSWEDGNSRHDGNINPMFKVVSCLAAICSAQINNSLLPKVVHLIRTLRLERICRHSPISPESPIPILNNDKASPFSSPPPRGRISRYSTRVSLSMIMERYTAHYLYYALFNAHASEMLQNRSDAAKGTDQMMVSKGLGAVTIDLLQWKTKLMLMLHLLLNLLDGLEIFDRLDAQLICRILTYGQLRISPPI